MEQRESPREAGAEKSELMGRHQNLVSTYIAPREAARGDPGPGAGRKGPAQGLQLPHHAPAWDRTRHHP